MNPNDPKTYAKEMLENVIPYMWKDGDVRELAGNTFDRIRKCLADAGVLQGSESQFEYQGHFGRLIIRRVR